jgi:hypothetical protein
MEEKDPLDPQTVFKINHSELKGITQCQKHNWKKRNDNEIECTKCPTILIINPEVLNDYLNG